MFGFIWITILAFLRISTHPRITKNPFSLDEVQQRIDTMLALSSVRIIDPDEVFGPNMQSYWSIHKVTAH